MGRKYVPVTILWENIDHETQMKILEKTGCSQERPPFESVTFNIYEDEDDDE